LVDSPCLNAGDQAAASICYEGLSSEICLDQLTNNVNHLFDTGVVDIGFHYDPFAPTPTPTPPPLPSTSNTGLQFMVIVFSLLIIFTSIKK